MYAKNELIKGIIIYLLGKMSWYMQFILQINFFNFIDVTISE